MTRRLHSAADAREIAREWERLRTATMCGTTRGLYGLPKSEERADELARFIVFHEDSIIAILRAYADAVEVKA